MSRESRIREARIALGMTQKDLAEAVGVSRQTVNAIEQGDYNPTIKLCRAICRVLDRSLDDLFMEEEAMDHERCFLVEKEALWAGMLENVLRSNGIPYMTEKKLGAGMAMKVGLLSEQVRFYVPGMHLKAARALVEELFAAKEE